MKHTDHASTALDIDQISENADIQKQQLQIALGLYCHEEIITKNNHPHPRVDIQNALIEKLKYNKEFLTNVLRELVCRGLGYHDPCENIDETIKLLIEAGANLHVDHLSVNYESPGLDFVHNYAGKSTFDKMNISLYSHRLLKTFLEKFSTTETKPNNSIERLLVNLIHALNAKYPDNNVMIQIIDELERHGVQPEQLDDKLDEVANDYFKKIMELEETNPKKIQLNKTKQKVKSFINQRYFFIKYLKTFSDAYKNPETDDEVCIGLISKDNEIQKKQLQIALGVGVNDEIPGLKSGRIVRDHQNKRLNLQTKLIESLSKNPNNQQFLSSVLRDFIIRPCDGAQIPCQNASKTVKLLLNAGADPNLDHIDINYDSPGRSFANYNAGQTLIEIVKIWENATTLSDESIAENNSILEAFKKISSTEINPDEIDLSNLIHQIHHLTTLNTNKQIHAPLAGRIADSLIKKYENLDSMTELFLRVQEQYFQRELNDEKQKPYYLEAILHAKDFLQNRILHQKFKEAYLTNSTDEDCIQFISKNPDILKEQLQLTLGLKNTQGEHLNQKLELQKVLIEELGKDNNNELFLSNVLRDFILYTCQGGKVPCDNAHLTMKLLIDAGADPDISKFDYDYDTDHKHQLLAYRGIPAWYELAKWSEHDSAANKMLLNTNPYPTILFHNYFQHLLNLISLSHDKNLSKERRIHLNQLAIRTARHFTANNLKTSQIAGLINEARNYNSYHPEHYRQAEGLLLEAIYQKEHKEELQLLRIIKISLIFSPLILPLIFTGIVAMVRAFKLNNTTFTVSTEDISLEKFKEKFSKRDDFADISEEKVAKKIQQTYATKFPVKEDGTTLRKAVVFNNKFSEATWVKSHKKDAKLPGFFSGTSGIAAHEEGRLKNDVRVYRANSSSFSKDS